MKTSLDCLPCFIRQTLEAARMVTDDPAVHELMVREVLYWISEMDLKLSPPELAQRIHRRLREITGENDPYRKDKKQHNAMAQQLLPRLRDQVAASEDPLFSAVHFAIAGNIIDLGAKSGLSEQEVHDALAHAASEPIDGDFDSFRKAAGQAENILYLTDNAGEIVFDQLLIEQLGPERVTAAVRGRPIINDATLQEAEESGLAGLVKTISNGSDAPGTLLVDCSEEFQHSFHNADLIISKGQGNFETLSEQPQNIFFLLKTKCAVVAETVGVPQGTHVLRSAREL